MSKLTDFIQNKVATPLGINPIAIANKAGSALEKVFTPNQSTMGVQTEQVPSDKTVVKTTTQPKVQTPSGFSASTLALQKQLNSQGAGLKEDGIMGPKTQSAMQTYKPQPTTQSTEPVSPKSSVIPNVSPATTLPPTVDTSRQGLLTQLTKMGTSSPTNVQDLQDQISAKREALRKLQDAQNKQEGMIETEPGLLNVQQGRLGAQQRLNQAQQQNLLDEISGLQNQLNLAQGLFGSQAGLIQGALGQQAPQQIAPGQTLITPSGQPLYGLGNTGGMGANDYQAWQNLQANIGAGIDYAQQAQGMVPKINNLSNAFSQLSPLVSTVNASPAAGINTVRQMLSAQGDANKLAAFDTAYQNFSNSIEDLVSGLGGDQAITSIPGFAASLVALRNKSLSLQGMQNLYNQAYTAAQQRAQELQKQGQTLSQAGTTSPANIPLNINPASGSQTGGNSIYSW